MTGKWRVRNNAEIKYTYQKPDIVDEIRKWRLLWRPGHACRKAGSLMYQVQCSTPVAKKPIGRPRLRWEDQMVRDVKQIVPDEEWRVLAMQRERWRSVCLSVWSWRPITVKKNIHCSHKTHYETQPLRVVKTHNYCFNTSKDNLNLAFGIWN